MGDEISSKLIVSIRKNTREGGIDSAELGSFEIGICTIDGGAEISRAEVELFGEFSGFLI